MDRSNLSASGLRQRGNRDRIRPGQRTSAFDVREQSSAANRVEPPYSQADAQQRSDEWRQDDNER
jgi:hypothetical protein